MNGRGVRWNRNNGERTRAIGEQARAIALHIEAAYGEQDDSVPKFSPTVFPFKTNFAAPKLTIEPNPGRLIPFPLLFKAVMNLLAGSLLEITSCPPPINMPSVFSLTVILLPSRKAERWRARWRSVR